MKNRKLVITGMVIVAVIVLGNLLKKDLWDVNAVLLKENVLSIDHSVETINLADIIPFDWEIAYSFDPYTTKDVIYDTVGYKWDYIIETVNKE